MTEEKSLIHLECTSEELFALCWDAAWLVRVTMANAGGSMDGEELEPTIRTAIYTAVCARDPDAPNHELSLKALEPARELHRQAAAKKGDA